MTIAETTRDALHTARGGKRFLKALLRGDFADDATIEARRAVCRGCPSRVRVALPGMKSESDWCGKPLHNGLKDPAPTCGCLIAAKTAVGSEGCPQRKWVAVPITITRGT